MNSATTGRLEPQGHRRRLFTVACCALVSLGVVRSALSTRLDGFTIDEGWHVTAGVSYVRTGDFRLNPEHPPLVKLWVGAALAGGAFHLPPFRPLLDKPDERRFVDDTIHLRNDARSVQRRARSAALALHALLLFAFAVAARRALGEVVALGGLAFLVIDPTVAAHMPVVMTDLSIALLSSIALLAAIVAFRTWHKSDLALVAVALGLALSAKLSGLITMLAVVALGGVKAILAPAEKGLARRAWRLGSLVAVVLVAFVILWGSYGFRFHESDAGPDSFNRPLAEKIDDLKSPLQRQVLQVLAQGRLLPRAYLWGTADVIRAGVEGRYIPLYFFGRSYHNRTPWYFFPGVLLVRLPLGVLALATLGAALLLLGKVPRSSASPIWCMLGLAALFLVSLAWSNSGYAGVRHALPVVPPLALLAALAVRTALAADSRFLCGFAALAIIAALASALPVMRPWEYHNELVGGAPNAYRYFNDEGLDLGQRTEELVRYYDTHLRASGEVPFDAYGLSREERQRRDVKTLSLDDEAPDSDEIKGTVFVSATSLAPSHLYDLAALRGAKPVARFGNLLVYRGEFGLPWLRASRRLWRAMDLLYSQNRDPVAAERLLAESVALYPQAYPAAIELGNLLIQRGARDEAIRAYRIAREHAPDGDELREQLERQIDRIATSPPASLSPIRNPWME